MNNKRSANDKLMREERKKNHLCIRCGNSDDFTREGRSYCKDCLEKVKEANKRYNKTEKGIASNRRRIKKWYNSQKEKHKCVTCGKSDSVPGKIYCSKCLDKARKRNNETHSKKKKEKENETN